MPRRAGVGSYQKPPQHSSPHEFGEMLVNLSRVAGPRDQDSHFHVQKACSVRFALEMNIRSESATTHFTCSVPRRPSASGKR
jgi:hypothetical protein